MHKIRIILLATVLTVSLAAVGAPLAFADDTVCRGVIGAVTVDNVVVPDSSTCRLEGTRVEGNVKVLTGARLTALQVRVDGNIQAEEARSVVVRSGSFVGGNIQIKQGGSASIDRVSIDGDLQFEENRAYLSATRNRIGGNLQAWKNSGGLTISANRIAENLQCKENNPAPTGGGNVAGDKEDQCARL